jgi:hypothetical protein
MPHRMTKHPSIRITLTHPRPDGPPRAIAEKVVFLVGWSKLDALDAYDQLTSCADPEHLHDLVKESQE